ncbi:right-handed parallel beta-helix repeat-containing protein [Kitasatospora sp. NPDC056783]|uniref:right-handed parallel beta-helix repeat-containing protein n=1 Tax=Kitasatospora sp. NPDC056783 TaxID=3345943 RepID=UPI0036A3490F
MSRVRSALTVGALLVGTVGLPAVGASSAAAAGGTLYVNNTAGAHCTDSGSGTEAAPYCTIGAAAAAVQPGQTVEIVDGVYYEDLTITRSGTAQAPITFRARQSWVVEGSGIGRPGKPVNGFVVKGAEHLRFEGLEIWAAAGAPTVVVDGAHDVSFDKLSAQSGNGVRVTNGSAGVLLGRSQITSLGGPAVVVDGGSTGTVVTTNMTRGVLVKDAPNTVVVANDVSSGCGVGIALDGASTGAVVENNVVNTSKREQQACDNPAGATGFTVGAGAVPGSKLDYNLIDRRSGGAGYEWAGTTYATQQAFTEATGQGAHDWIHLALVERGPTAPADHRIDSADENAPGMLPTDFNGRAAVDDPTVPNTGTGSGFRDRGAFEFTDVGSAYTPAGPTRLLDTRTAQAVPAYGTVDLPVAGVAGVPATGVTAVTMNVTVTDPQQDGHLNAYPHGDAVPIASVLNWPAKRTTANQVTVRVKDGNVSFYNASGGTVQLIADLAGYYSPKGSLFHPQGPTRLLDTRAAIGIPAAQAVPAYGTVDLPVTGVAGVPATGVTAVTMNVTVADPTQEGHLTVYPHGGAAPNASNINWTAGRTIPNLVTVPVKDGKVSFHNASGGTVQLIADLAGYFDAAGRTAYHPIDPERRLDTRLVWSGEDRSVPARGTVNIDARSNTTSMTLNVTVTAPGAEGHLTVYPHGDAAPNASNLNFLRGETVSNQVVVPVKDGKISLYNASDARLHLVVDEFGDERY